MLKGHSRNWTIVLAASWLIIEGTAPAFEGTISAICTQGGEGRALLYTATTNSLRIEVTGSTQPEAVDLVDLRSGMLTLVLPHSRSYVRLARTTGGVDALPGLPLPPGNLASGAGLQAGMPGLPMEAPRRGSAAGLRAGLDSQPGLPKQPGTLEGPGTPAAGLGISESTWMRSGTCGATPGARTSAGSVLEAMEHQWWTLPQET